MFLREIPILLHHGRQYVPDLRHVELPDTFRGRPVISPDITPEENTMIASLCPVAAIGVQPCSIDLGKCVFCKECGFILPGKIKFTSDYRMATNDRKKLVILPGEEGPLRLDPGKIRDEIHRIFRRSLKLRQVSAGGDNSAEMELNAAGNVNFDMGRFGIEFVASPRHADGIVITGPVTSNMAEALQICYEAIPDPKLVILAGSDAIGGGMFSDSPAINRSFLKQVAIDLFIPGNPPHPLTFINGVLDLIGHEQ
ncbi:MAG: NADH:ubiquinone oxidoreductase [Bacteroidales bacterium]|jgi:Ni,Fe-hydrogenase III small subunit|nr:NADH:ubiquinone oxidoreductase [Bacteroidales bacterium]